MASRPDGLHQTAAITLAAPKRITGRPEGDDLGRPWPDHLGHRAYDHLGRPVTYDFVGEWLLSH